MCDDEYTPWCIYLYVYTWRLGVDPVPENAAHTLHSPEEYIASYTAKK